MPGTRRGLERVLNHKRLHLPLAVDVVKGCKEEHRDCVCEVTHRSLRLLLVCGADLTHFLQHQSAEFRCPFFEGGRDAALLLAFGSCSDLAKQSVSQAVIQVRK